MSTNYNVYLSYIILEKEFVRKTHKKKINFCF